jgi:hypothetical protein
MPDTPEARATRLEWMERRLVRTQIGLNRMSVHLGLPPVTEAEIDAEIARRAAEGAAPVRPTPSL